MSKLFSSIKIGDLELKNRFMLAPMENGLAEFGGEVTDKLIDFFVDRIKNEVAIIITGSIGVSPEGRGLPTQLSAYDDKFIPGLKRMTDAVHQAGGKIGAQIYHAGRQATEAVTGIQPIAPSAMPCQMLGNDPREMTIDDIREMRGKYISATKRCIQAGFDLIEVHFAHGYLLHSFLSPHSNKRTDEYGGSFENRMRFPMEVLQDVIAACEGKVPVTIRISADEYLEDGLKFDEVKLICKEVEKVGVKAISLTAASYDSVEYAIQPMFIKQGFLVPYAEELKKLLHIPVIVAARLNSAELIESIIENDKADMVAIGRGLIADEHLIVKMKAKAYDEIRYCVACNQGCIDRVLFGQGIKCLVNARSGNEAERNIEKASVSKNVVVIGAGPAGIEAARVLKLRGHHVTVVDRMNRIGGKMQTLAAPPEKETFLLFRDYLYKQLVKMEIAFVQKDIKAAADLEEFHPDVVIVATGSTQSLPPIKGIDGSTVVMAEDIINGDAKAGTTVAVIGGGLVGTETAKLLAKGGAKVHIIEMLDGIAKDMGPLFIGHSFAFLNEHGVEQHVNAKVLEIREDAVVLEDEEIKADQVVIAAGYVPNNGLFEELKKTYGEVHLVGDAKSPRRVIDAVEEGYLAASAV